MKLNGEFIYLNSEERTGVKDPSKTYYFVALMQGAETVTLMCQDKAVYEEISKCQQFSPVILNFEYNDRYGRCRVVGLLKK